MNTNELFTRLSYGPLSNLSIGSEGAGTIAADKQLKVLSYVNEGLLRLYSRFVLRENDLVVMQYGHITEYPLLKKYATFGPALTDPLDVKFILDSEAALFDDDVIKILKVTNAENKLVPLNDVNHDKAFFTPQPNILQITYPVLGELSVVTYQARHPIVTLETLNAELLLPATLETALQSYVAYLVYFHMGGQDNGALAAGHLGNYERVCAEAVLGDLVNTSMSSTSSKFAERGFV